MYKSVVVLLIVTLAIASYAKPRQASSRKVTYHVDDEDIMNNEILREHRVFNGLTPREEKELALVTNEVKPKKGEPPVPIVPKASSSTNVEPKEDEARPESGAPNSELKESSAVKEVQIAPPNSEQKGKQGEESKVSKEKDTRPQADQPQPPSNKKFIDFDKPPSSPVDYLMDMLYGFASWVYKKIFG